MQGQKVCEISLE